MSDAFEFLRPNKKLSQLIVRSWLDGNRLQIDKNFLVENGILSQEEADVFEVEVDEGEGADLTKFNAGGSIDAVNFRIYLPYPQQPPDGVTKEYMYWWIGQATGFEPWVSVFNTVSIRDVSGLDDPIPPPFNILRPSKKLSQLIAQSWLPGNEAIGEALLNNPKQFLRDNDLLSDFEAGYVEVEVDPNPEGPPYLGKIILDEYKEGPTDFHSLSKKGYKKYIPYPQRHLDLKEEQLEEWVNSPVNAAPYTPFQISQWIPYTC